MTRSRPRDPGADGLSAGPCGRARTVVPLTLTILLLWAVVPAPAADTEIDPMTFFVGKWSLVLYGEGGEIVGRATSHGYPALDGTMIQIDYRGLGPDGGVVFRGTTLRTRSPEGGWVVRWAMSDQAGYTYLEEELRDGVLHGNGRGVDAAGTFLERYRYFDLSEDGYSFQLERSYDDGQVWSPGPKSVARRSV